MSRYSDNRNRRICARLLSAMENPHNLTIDEWAEKVRWAEILGVRLYSAPGRDASRKCNALPGSEEKIAAMESRARAGEHIHHPLDRRVRRERRRQEEGASGKRIHKGGRKANEGDEDDPGFENVIRVWEDRLQV